MAYVGMFSSPLRDVLPTQVDLPPGNGRGIHLFQVDRATGALAPRGTFDLGTSPSCLALNRAATRLYSSNETGRVGEGKHGTVTAYPRSFAFDPTGRFLYCCNQRADNVTVFRVDAKKGGLAFTGHYAPVGNPSSIVFVDLAKAG
jgi:6-phosphogluconolactonase (cycloisomerase 2 family)